MAETQPTVVKATGPRALRWGLLLGGLFLLAFAVRFAFFLRAGVNSFGAYDDGVHYAAAANLVAGNLPYKDFLFLHPPGIILLGYPFAAAAHLVGDPVAFTAFRILLQIIGALSAVLVAVALRRFGWAAALTGGVLYALSFPAVFGARGALLEPTGELGVLLALVALQRGLDTARPNWFLLSGFAAGMACDMKAWYVGSAAVLLVFVPGIVNRLRFVLGGFITIAVIYVPFFLQAPQQMVQMIAFDQLGRPRDGDASFGVRARSLLGVNKESIWPHVPAKPVVAALLLVTVFLALLLLAEKRAWVLLGLLGVNGAIVLLSPSYFQHYAILTATPLALVGGAAVGFLPTQLADKPSRVRALATAFATIGILAAVLVNARHDLHRSGERLDPKLAAAIERAPGCVMSDDPTVLALSNRVTKNLKRGCEVRPDLSGMSYDWAKLIVDGKPVGRKDNPVFQKAAVDYLLSGDSFIRVRSSAFSYTDESRARLNQGAVLFEGHGRKLFSSRPLNSNG